VSAVSNADTPEVSERLLEAASLTDASMPPVPPVCNRLKVPPPPPPKLAATGKARDPDAATPLLDCSPAATCALAVLVAAN
jgi:hypothetical protein